MSISVGGNSMGKGRTRPGRFLAEEASWLEPTGARVGLQTLHRWAGKLLALFPFWVRVRGWRWDPNGPEPDMLLPLPRPFCP